MPALIAFKSETPILCGCAKRGVTPKNFLDLTGKKFGRLTVSERAINKANTKWKTYWHCTCDCGATIIVIGAHLKNGNTSSCGCLQRELVATRSAKHLASKRGSKTPEYESWSAMRTRCVNSKRRDWKDYGGRGIKVCDRWMNSFENFLADMGLRPAETSLDRINVDGDYEPSNCRWATATEQRGNQRKAKKCQPS